MSNVDIYAILASKPHNKHHLDRYFNFILACGQANSSISEDMYIEKHHICPRAKDLFPEYKSFKGYPWNCVSLTTRQHFVAHRILWKAYSGSQAYAFSKMCNLKFHEKGKPTSRWFEKLKMEASDLTRDTAKYTFIHKETRENFTGTRFEMEKKIGKNIKRLFGKSNQKTAWGWQLMNRIESDGNIIELHPKEFYENWKMPIEIRNKLSAKKKGMPPSLQTREVSMDHTKYKFQNMKTNEVFIGTRVEMKNYIGFEVDPLFGKHRKTMHDWGLISKFEPDEIAINQPEFFKNGKIDKNIYKFINKKTGQEFEGTRETFKLNIGKKPDPMFNKCRKSVLGWVLVEQ